MAPTLFTAAIILGAIIIFILLFVLLHKKGHNKQLARQKIIIADMVWKNKLEISEQESINNYFIAIDKINFVLLYIHFQSDTHEARLIDLWNIKSVKVNIEDNCAYEHRKGKTILIDKQLDKIIVELSLINQNEKDSLLVYQSQDGMQDLLHIKNRAYYWAQIINDCVKEMPHSQKRRYA